MRDLLHVSLVDAQPHHSRTACRCRALQARVHRGGGSRHREELDRQRRRGRRDVFGLRGCDSVGHHHNRTRHPGALQYRVGQLQGLGKRYDEQLDVGDRRNAHAALREIQPRKKFSIRQYDRVPGKSALREFAADMLAPLLGAIGLTMPLIRLVSKDSAEYLAGDTDFADRVRERIRAKLCEALDRDGRVWQPEV